MTLYALPACAGTLPLPANAPSGTACTLERPPTVTPDSATIAFQAVGTTREQCALSIAAETMRPWPLASSERWTVHLSLFPTHATARPLTSENARDAIDAGAPLLATDDVDLVAYAMPRADLETVPLPWDRTYLYLTPGRGRALGGAVGPDAVRVDARLAEPPPCDSIAPPGESLTGAQSSPRIVYHAADRTARALAERVVALADRGGVTAAGLSAADLDAALQQGADLAYIVALPRARYCDALAALAQRASWLSGSVTPLIDTRAHAILPRLHRP